MKDVRRHAKLSQQANTADAEQHLLHDSRFAIAAVKMSRHPTIGLDVLRNVRVEKIKRNSSDISAPHLGQHVALANQDFDTQRRIVSVLTR